MPHHLRYRYFLPLLVTLVNLCLFLACVVYKASPPAPTWSPIVKAELILNLPATTVAPGFVGLFFPENSGDAPVVGITTLLAPLLWFWIGRWVDRQLGNIKQKQDRRRTRVFRKILRFLAFFYLLFSLLIFTPINPTPSPALNFYAVVMELWLIGYLVCSYWGEKYGPLVQAGPAGSV